MRHEPFKHGHVHDFSLHGDVDDFSLVEQRDRCDGQAVSRAMQVTAQT